MSNETSEVERIAAELATQTTGTLHGIRAKEQAIALLRTQADTIATLRTALTAATEQLAERDRTIAALEGERDIYLAKLQSVEDVLSGGMGDAPTIHNSPTVSCPDCEGSAASADEREEVTT